MVALLIWFVTRTKVWPNDFIALSEFTQYHVLIKTPVFKDTRLKNNHLYKYDVEISPLTPPSSHVLLRRDNCYIKQTSRYLNICLINWFIQSVN